jgi:hypothetical protein
MAHSSCFQQDNQRSHSDEQYGHDDRTETDQISSSNIVKIHSATIDLLPVRHPQEPEQCQPAEIDESSAHQRKHQGSAEIRLPYRHSGAALAVRTQSSFMAPNSRSAGSNSFATSAGGVAWGSTSGPVRSSHACEYRVIAHTTIMTGFSIRRLNAPMSSAPSAPSTAR